MLKNNFQLIWALILSISVGLTACTEEVLDDVEVENFTEEAVYNLQQSGNCGRFGCFEFVFPITIEFPDNTTAEAASYDELKSTIRTWKENNPDAEDKPTLGFPLEVVSEEGEVISVADQDELRALRMECRRDYYRNNNHRKNRGRGTHCFDIVFPVTLEFPDGTSETAADKEAMRDLLKTWKENNPGSSERPELGYPLTVELEDGTQVTVESQEDLQNLKEECSAS